MEVKHIKLNYENSLKSKKNFLNFEINILNLLRKIQNYKLLRKREFYLKNQLKAKFSEIRNNIDLINSYCPEEAIETEKIEKKSVVGKQKKELKYDKNIQLELEEIKRKLEKLR